MGTSARLSDATLSVTVRRRFEHSAEQVYDAWLDPACVRRWLFATPDGQMVRVEIDARVGGRFVITERRGDMDAEHFGEYVELDRPRRIAFLLSAPKYDQTQTLVEVDIAAHGSGCELTLTHSRVMADAIDKLTSGWAMVLNALATALETPGPDSARTIELRRTFDAPRELVWQAWTDPALTVRWWGPNGFTTTTLEHDLRVGGVWRHTMHGPDGTDYPNRKVYKVIEPPSRLVYDAGWDRDGGEMFEAQITFTDLGDGQTEVVMRSIFPTIEARDHAVREYGAIEGGKQTLARLGEFLAERTAAATRLTETSRLVQAPAELVYRAITTPELLAQWWGPAGFANTFAECDIRPGGQWRFTMHGPDGQDYPNRKEFLEVSPQRIVVHHIAETHEFWLTITLTPHSAGTAVGWRQLFAQAEELASCRHFVDPANEQNLDRLAELLAKLQEEGNGK